MSALRKAQKKLEKQIAKLRAARTKAFNGWLEKCVLEHCPEAHALVKSGDKEGARKALADQKFRFQENYDQECFEFLQGDTVIARAKFPVEFKNNNKVATLN